MPFLLSKNGLVCEFLHTPMWKIIFLATFHTFGEYEILHTCTYLNFKQEFEVRQAIPMPKIGFFGPQNTAVPLGRSGKKLFLQL
jgi:hypothetical protein